MERKEKYWEIIEILSGYSDYFVGDIITKIINESYLSLSQEELLIDTCKDLIANVLIDSYEEMKIEDEYLIDDTKKMVEKLIG